jgi:hypothetical protein
MISSGDKEEREADMEREKLFVQKATVLNIVLPKVGYSVPLQRWLHSPLPSLLYLEQLKIILTLNR